ncbi:MAG: aldolase/citrate lyase family protein [Patescibacteria group bacterium]
MIKEKIKNKQAVLGTWCDIPSPSLANVIAKAGLDFIIIDLEHGPMDYKSAQEMAMAAEAGGCEAIVRVPSNEESSILKSLDMGGAGIIVPHIKNIEDRDRAINFAKFKPQGNRSYNPYIRAFGYSSLADIKQNNQDTLLAVMLEDINSLDSLEKIADSAEVDVIYVAKYDLAVSMGHSSDINHSEVNQTVESAIKRIIQSGKAAGCMVHSPAEIDFYKKLGANFLVYKVDSSVVYDAYKNISGNFKGKT